MMTNIKQNNGVFRMRQINHCKVIRIFKIAYCQNILIDFDVFPKINNGYFVVWFDQVCSWNLV